MASCAGCKSQRPTAWLLHELYFRNLAPAKVDVSRYLEGHMREHMGSIETWAADFTRCALAAKAWAVLVYDPYDDRWHNAVMESNDSGIWMGANPLVVCDLADHALAKDYPRREGVRREVHRPHRLERGGEAATRQSIGL